MLRDFDNQNIITKSQVYSQISSCDIIDGMFAKTINYSGIHCNFCIDFPEAPEQEQQKKQEDIVRFTNILMSEFDYFDERIDDLLKNNNIDDIFRDDVFTDLSYNENLLCDLGIA